MRTSRYETRQDKSSTGSLAYRGDVCGDSFVDRGEAPLEADFLAQTPIRKARWVAHHLAVTAGIDLDLCAGHDAPDGIGDLADRNAVAAGVEKAMLRERRVRRGDERAKRIG